MVKIQQPYHGATLLCYNDAREIPGDLAKKLSSLCLRDRGTMQVIFRMLRNGLCDKSRVVLYQYPSSGMIVGWALLRTRDSMKVPHDIMVYVRKSHRRQGFGSRLVKAICSFEEKDTKIKVYYPACETTRKNEFYMQKIADPRFVQGHM